MKQLKLAVTPREGTGRGVSRRLRNSGKIPAVLYGKHTEPTNLQVDTREFSQLLKEIAGSTAIIDISDADAAEPRLSILQEVQRDPITDNLIHVDLHEVAANEKMEIDITVHVTGEAFGVKNESGILELVSHQVLIRCLPKDLPNFVEVNVTEMHVNETLHVSDLPAIDGVEYMDDPDRPVVSCVESAVAEEPAEASTEVAAAPAAAAPAEKK